MTAAPAPGTILLGRYRVERGIGSGGMGVVLEATHLALGHTVAIKVLNEAHARDQEVVARFLREARIAATLPSEHIARVSDVGQTESGAPYLVMELLEGHDLEAEIAQRGKLPVAEAVDLMLEACEGVAAAHARGLVHRDLKPANLFLASRPNRAPILKVLDFGLSKEASGENASITGTDAVFGTPQYMSPEQIQSTKNVDARSDQHALGMILYELLAGEPAYTAESVTQLIVVIATMPPPRVRAKRSDVAAKLEEAIVRALAKNPGDRFPDLGAFAAAIAPFGGPEAMTRAALVKRALEAPPVRASGDEPSGARRLASDQAPTLPLGLPRAPAHTHAAVTSSASSLARSKKLSGKRAVIAAIAVAATLVVIALALLGTGGDAARGDGEVATLGHEEQHGSVSAGASAALVATAPALPEASANVAAAPASASASATKSTSSPRATTRPTSGKDALKRAIGKFGERK